MNLLRCIPQEYSSFVGQVGNLPADVNRPVSRAFIEDSAGRFAIGGRLPAYRSASAATRAPLAEVCNGSSAIRISVAVIGSSASRKIFSKRSRKPSGRAVPPLSMMGRLRPDLGRLREFENACFI